MTEVVKRVAARVVKWFSPVEVDVYQNTKKDSGFSVVQPGLFRGTSRCSEALQKVCAVLGVPFPPKFIKAGTLDSGEWVMVPTEPQDPDRMEVQLGRGRRFVFNLYGLVLSQGLNVPKEGSLFVPATFAPNVPEVGPALVLDMSKVERHGGAAGSGQGKTAQAAKDKSPGTSRGGVGTAAAGPTPTAPAPAPAAPAPAAQSPAGGAAVPEATDETPTGAAADEAAASRQD